MRTKRKLSKFAVVGTAVTCAVFVLALLLQQAPLPHPGPPRLK